jgi:hypothetical protein
MYKLHCFVQRPTITEIPVDGAGTVPRAFEGRVPLDKPHGGVLGVRLWPHINLVDPVLTSREYPVGLTDLFRFILAGIPYNDAAQIGDFIG